MEHQPIIPMRGASSPMDPRRWAGAVGHVLSSNSFVLGMALILAVFVPGLLHEQVASSVPWFPISAQGIDGALIGACIAIGAAHLSLRRMSVLPLISERSLILPTFAVIFGSMIIVLALSRLPIEYYHLCAAFVIGLAWYSLVFAMRERFVRPVVALLGAPYEFPVELPGNVEWKILDKPVLEEKVAAMVVDPLAALDIASTQFITQLVLDGIPVYHRTHFEEGLSGRVRFDSHADNNFGALLPSLGYLQVKRLIDLVGAVLLLPLLVPTILVAALVTKLDSPGPVFYRQSRMGFRGQAFSCYKLRTMRIDREGPAYTLQADPRVTRVGRYLRKWRIDELPQVINVLKGDMSWIGPRPEVVELATRYSVHVPFYDYRHAVRPGISGWAAVHQGNVAQVEAARVKLEYDFFYIKYFSFWLDFLIFFQTLRTIWSGFGSR